MNLKSSIALWLAFLLLITAVLVTPGNNAGAQATTPVMTASAAYSGYFKYGEWLPVWVELENQGQDIEAQIRVEVSTSQGLIVYEVPVSLPSGSHKRIPVYVLPNNFSRELAIKLVSEGKTILSSKAAVRPQSNISYFSGLIAPQRGALSLLRGIKLPGQERPTVLMDLTLAEIPERADALHSFDLLVFNDVDTTKLTPGQKDALVGWIQKGGHLVIGGGAGAQRTLAGLPDSLAPLKITATSEVQGADVGSLAQYAQTDPIVATGPFVIAQGDLGSESRVAASAKDLPLLVEKPVGYGMVHFVALDLAGAPFNGWTGCQAFWETVIGPAGAYPENMPFDMSPRTFLSSSLIYALSNIPSLDLPSVKGIIIMLGIYILIVGPINYLALRRMRRLHLAWVTIPLITAIFALGTFGLGYTMRGNDLVLNKIALVQVGSNGDAPVTSYMGLFSPRQQAYEISVQGEGLLSPMTGYEYDPWGTGGVNTTGGEMVFVQGQPARLRGLTVNQWSMQSFMSEGTWKGFGSLEGNLRLENETLVGTVKNSTQYALSDVVVTLQNRIQRLGDMAAGEEKEVNLGLANLQADRFNSSISYRLYQENLEPGKSPTRLDNLKMNIISSVFENGTWMKTISSRRFPSSSGDNNGGVFVFGWMEQAPPEVSIEGNTLAYKTTTLVYSSIDYRLPTSGYLSLPPGLIPGSITKYPISGGVCGTSTSVSLGQGQAEMEFSIPSYLTGVKVTTLKVSLYQDSGSVGGLPEVALYQWENESWTTIQEPIQGTNIIQNAAPYIKEGKVRIRLGTEGNNNYSCNYVDLGLEAEQPGGGGTQ